ncbi:hypothetical protein [Bosea sp. UC22_33]|uniref:hypothetical protein n=1 Tax=Bosea sp. UC22_33 TaxID=3350165 RepID=UPI00366AC9DF
MMTHPDPVFAAIERWRPLWDAYLAACDIEDGEASDAAVDLVYLPAMTALGDVYRTEPTTPAGLLAIMAVMLEADGDHLDLIEPDEPRDMDDAERGMIAIFSHAKRMLGGMR